VLRRGLRRVVQKHYTGGAVQSESHSATCSNAAIEQPKATLDQCSSLGKSDSRFPRFPRFLKRFQVSARRAGAG
jgi:hypothetical protein